VLVLLALAASGPSQACDTVCDTACRVGTLDALQGIRSATGWVPAVSAGPCTGFNGSSLPSFCCWGEEVCCYGQDCVSVSEQDWGLPSDPHAPCGALFSLYIKDAGLSGNVDALLPDLRVLDRFGLSEMSFEGNQLTGTLPTGLADLNNLTRLVLGSNSGWRRARARVLRCIAWPSMQGRACALPAQRAPHRPAGGSASWRGTRCPAWSGKCRDCRVQPRLRCPPAWAVVSSRPAGRPAPPCTLSMKPAHEWPCCLVVRVQCWRVPSQLPWEGWRT
jgi:hypothetical protein